MALRTRPGERAAWITLQAKLVSLDELRQAARRRSLPVDVVAALLLEWGVCVDIIRVDLARLAQTVDRELAEPRLAPDDSLRAWERQLAGDGPAPNIDELPEVCIPQRLMFRLPRNISAAMLDLNLLDVAVACERAACRRGMSLETWLLHQALAG